jgi:hypothetical protein
MNDLEQSVEEEKPMMMRQPAQVPKLLEIKPMPKELVDAIRAEFRKLIEDPDFIGKLTTIERLASSTRDLALTLGDPSSDALRGRAGGFVNGIATSGTTLYGSDSYSVPAMSNPYAAPEQFGARAIRELVGLAPTIAAAAANWKQTPTSLVEAIGKAREQGLKELAEKLETKLSEMFGQAEPLTAALPEPAPAAPATTNGVAVGSSCTEEEVHS